MPPAIIQCNIYIGLFRIQGIEEIRPDGFYIQNRVTNHCLWNYYSNCGEKSTLFNYFLMGNDASRL